MSRIFLRLCLIAGIAGLSISQCMAQTTPGDPFASVQFLVGSWKGTGNSDSGIVSGTSVFSFDLDGKILTRRDRSVFPSNKSKEPPYDQMMIMYPDPSTAHLEANYWDSVGHVIHYVTNPTTNANLIQFISDPAAPGPSFRLTYSAVPKGLDVLFEIKPTPTDGYHMVADGLMTPVLKR